MIYKYKVIELIERANVNLKKKYNTWIGNFYNVEIPPLNSWNSPWGGDLLRREGGALEACTGNQVNNG